MINKTFAEALKEARLKRNINLEQASESTGIDKSTIYRYEKCISRIPVENLIILLEFYQEDIEFFLKQTIAKMQK